MADAGAQVESHRALNGVEIHGVKLNRLVWTGPLTIVLAIAATSVVRLIAVALLRPDSHFLPLSPWGPPTFSFAGAFGAVIAYALVGRFSRRPTKLFESLALATLILSFIPPLMVWASNAIPGTTGGNIVALLVMHIVVWAISVGLLTRLTRAAK